MTGSDLRDNVAPNTLDPLEATIMGDGALEIDGVPVAVVESITLEGDE